MQHRELGRSGIEASAVTLGTWAIGGWLWGGTDRVQARRAIEAALDAGIDAVDTAPIYGFGLSEEIVGEAVRGRRDRVVIMTKCGMVWDREQGEHFFDTDERGPGGPGPALRVFRCLKPESIRDEGEASLRRLGTDYIDLYQTHWQ
ncbi:MAG TPA: aldo/keto reductase, partial [bacterium]|nr:aldo/keto reductase [bacterium]